MQLCFASLISLFVAIKQQADEIAASEFYLNFVKLGLGLRLLTAEFGEQLLVLLLDAKNLGGEAVDELTMNIDLLAALRMLELLVVELERDLFEVLEERGHDVDERERVAAAAARFDDQRGGRAGGRRRFATGFSGERVQFGFQLALKFQSFKKKT